MLLVHYRRHGRLHSSALPEPWAQMSIQFHPLADRSGSRPQHRPAIRGARLPITKNFRVATPDQLATSPIYAQLVLDSL